MSHQQAQFIFPHERLEAFHVALELAEVSQRVADRIPRGHRRLADQLQRSGSAPALLIAEGAVVFFFRINAGDKRQRFSEASGEAGEAAATVAVGRRLGIVTEQDEADVHYIFRLKTPQRELWREANRVLSPLADRTLPEAETDWESDTRGRLKRQLWRTAEMAGWNDWQHLAQVWLVRTLRQPPDGPVEAIEDRYYLTSLGWNRLDARQILDAVRLHWGVENDANGTADIFFDEDHSPCSKTGEGIVCAGLLRLIAMNLCQLYRHRRRSKAHRRQPWKLVFDDIFFVLRLPASIIATNAGRPT